MDEVLTVKRKPTVEEIGKHENFEAPKFKSLSPDLERPQFAPRKLGPREIGRNSE